MIFLLAVFNYTELTSDLDIMTSQLLVYVDNVFLLGENKNTVNKKTEALLNASVNVVEM
jgi:hypothetical protein